MVESKEGRQKENLDEVKIQFQDIDIRSTLRLDKDQ